MKSARLDSSNHPSLTYRPGIDGMRAIAVLGVVLYHASFGPPGGFVGVDVFFVISGFLITSLLEQELAGNGRIDLAAFYARRVRRLLPALGLVLLATVAGCFAILSPYSELSEALRSVGASSVFGANVYFQYTTGDYFGSNVNHLPLLHLWSLGVEEQYYLLWPIALYVSRRLSLNVRRVVFVTFAVASLGFAEWALYHGSQAAFYAMPARWWELSLGALVAWAPPAGDRAGRREGMLGLVVVILAMAFPTTHFPGVGALPATVGAALLIHASTTRGGVWRLLASGPMVLVGRVSYPFYLWHWPLLALAAVAMPGELPPPWRAGLVLAAFGLAYATWRWLEKPLHRVRLAAPRQLVTAALLACVASAVLSVQVADEVKRTPPSTDPAVLAAHDLPKNMGRCHANAFSPVELPDPGECTLGGSGTPRIVIWGDSHALAFQPFATALAKREGKLAIAYSRDACAPAIGYDNGKRPSFASQCKAFNAIALKSAVTMDTVILASRWPNPAERNFAADLTATVNALAPHVRRIFIIGDTPSLPSAVPECIFRHALQKCDLPRPAFIERSAPIRALLSSLAVRYPNVVYVEPTDFFCTKDTCPGVRDGVALYWDDNHISTTAAAAFGEFFLKGFPENKL
jgi:Predicted acyltransferases